MTNGDKIIDTLVDNAAGVVKRVAKKVVNGLFVDKEHSRPYIEDGRNSVKEYASSKEHKADFTADDFDGGWAPIDNWHELTDEQLPGFVNWNDVELNDEEEGLQVTSETGIYTFTINGLGPRFVMLEQLCNELDITYDEYRKIIELAPEIFPVLVPHGEFQKGVFNRKAEKNADLLEPHYLIPLSSLVRTVVKIRFSSKDAIEFKRAISEYIKHVIASCLTASSIED
jgi:hypothetical protein